MIYGMDLNRVWHKVKSVTLSHIDIQCREGPVSFSRLVTDKNVCVSYSGNMCVTCFPPEKPKPNRAS